MTNSFLKTQILFGIFLFLQIGCATMGDSVSDNNEAYLSQTQTQGSLTAKMLIHWKKSSRKGMKYFTQLHFSALGEQKMRLDITASLIGHLASLTLNNNRMEIFITENQKYYLKPATERNLNKILNIPINPKILYNIFFFLPIKSKFWKCVRPKKFIGKDDEKLLFFCKHKRKNIKITWKIINQKGEVFIDHSKAKIHIKIKSFQSKIENKKNLFRLR